MAFEIAGGIDDHDAVAVGDSVEAGGVSAVGIALYGHLRVDRHIEDAYAVLFFGFAYGLLKLFEELVKATTVDEPEGDIGEEWNVEELASVELWCDGGSV